MTRQQIEEIEAIREIMEILDDLKLIHREHIRRGDRDADEPGMG